MSYFQVLITLDTDQKKHYEVFKDLDEKTLKNLFIKFYQKGRNFVAGNEVFKVYQIKKVFIIATENKNEIERKKFEKADLERIERINSESNSFVYLGIPRGYNVEDIIECGIDVTSKFIKGPPGYAKQKKTTKKTLPPVKEKNKFYRLAFNGWTITIGGGLLVILIAKVLGLLG